MKNSAWKEKLKKIPFGLILYYAVETIGIITLLFSLYSKAKALIGTTEDESDKNKKDSDKKGSK